MNKLFSFIKKRYLIIVPILLLIFVAQIERYSELTSSGTFGAALRLSIPICLAGVGAIYSESNSLPNFSSSILWNNFPQSIYAHEDSLFAIFSNIDDGWIGEGNINTDPLFCDADSSDYSLAENSPCIGTGEYGSNMGSMNTGCTSVIIPPSNFSLLIPEDNYQLNIDELYEQGGHSGINEV